MNKERVQRNYEAFFDAIHTFFDVQYPTVTTNLEAHGRDVTLYVTGVLQGMLYALSYTKSARHVALTMPGVHAATADGTTFSPQSVDGMAAMLSGLIPPDTVDYMDQLRAVSKRHFGEYVRPQRVAPRLVNGTLCWAEVPDGVKYVLDEGNHGTEHTPSTED